MLGTAGLWCERPSEAEAVISRQELSHWLIKGIDTFHVFPLRVWSAIMTGGHTRQISSHSNVLLLRILLFSAYYEECYLSVEFDLKRKMLVQFEP